MGKHIHKLLSKNIEAKTGLCAACGPIQIRKKGIVWHCREGQKKYSKGWEAAQSKLKIKSGLFLREEAARIRAGAICEICGSTEKICIDHCHKSGIFRGTLCQGCNFGLGFFKDDPARLVAAIAYLKKFL